MESCEFVELLADGFLLDVEMQMDIRLFNVHDAFYLTCVAFFQRWLIINIYFCGFNEISM